jgi:hypothetical protein
MSKKKAEKLDKRIEWHLERWPLSKLKPFDKNPRIITDESLKVLEASFDEIGMAQPININTDGTILSGHARFMQLSKEGATDADVYVPDRKLTPKQEEAVIIRMNKNVAGSWDFDKLMSDFDVDDLLKWGFSEDELAVPDPNESGEGSEGDAYTKKIEIPLYEPKGEKPDIKELVDLKKTEELVKKINSSKLPDQEKAFLKLAAQRHLVFDYEKIAEFYAHADKPTQELMEQSALVIIDFEKAIENGFVSLTKELIEAHSNEENEE